MQKGSAGRGGFASAGHIHEADTGPMAIKHPAIQTQRTELGAGETVAEMQATIPPTELGV